MIGFGASLKIDIKMELNDKVSSVLAEYHQRIESESDLMKSLPFEEGMRRRDEFLLPVGKEVGQFLYSLTIAAEAKVILEVGTSYGYSTVWLAAAAKESGGKVISLEIDAQKVAYAKTQVEKAGLAEYVEFRIGDAVKSIQGAEENFDLVLLDLWKDLYVPCFKGILPKLNKGAYVIADNIIFPPNAKPEMEKYQHEVRATNSFDTILLPIGSGLEVSKLN